MLGCRPLAGARRPIPPQLAFGAAGSRAEAIVLPVSETDPFADHTVSRARVADAATVEDVLDVHTRYGAYGVSEVMVFCGRRLPLSTRVGDVAGIGRVVLFAAQVCGESRDVIEQDELSRLRHVVSGDQQRKCRLTRIRRTSMAVHGRRVLYIRSAMGAIMMRVHGPLDAQMIGPTAAHGAAACDLFCGGACTGRSTRRLVIASSVPRRHPLSNE